MNRKNLIEKHPVELGLAAAAVIFGFANFGNIQRSWSVQSQLREEASLLGKQTNQMQLEKTKIEELGRIANERLEYCEMIYSINPDEKGGLQHAAFGPGSAVVKGEYADLYKGRRPTPNDPPGHFLPAGMTVCGAYGNTGITEVDGTLGGIAVVRHYAVATDKEALKRALERSAKASRPINNY